MFANIPGDKHILLMDDREVSCVVWAEKVDITEKYR